MILYLDTSALLKKYLKEEGSNDVISLWKKTSAIVTSTVAYAETLASIYRKKRETGEFDQRFFKAVLTSFQKDWKSFIHVDVNKDLNETIDKLTIAYPLRGFDAIHLASALILYEKIQENFIFVCYDKRLLKAAKEEGLNTFPGDL
ncbi:MAG: PIN domain-containing protein [Deltaproteobacteria bacterium]|jgi:predicted nucleic acid-binding protein|nr:MAG: PIN domain-containing protein [Deltaproteobacteria bacterium]